MIAVKMQMTIKRFLFIAFIGRSPFKGRFFGEYLFKCVDQLLLMALEFLFILGVVEAGDLALLARKIAYQAIAAGHIGCMEALADGLSGAEFS